MKCNDWEWLRSVSFMLRSRTVSSSSAREEDESGSESGESKGGVARVMERVGSSAASFVLRSFAPASFLADGDTSGWPPPAAARVCPPVRVCV